HQDSHAKRKRKVQYSTFNVQLGHPHGNLPSSLRCALEVERWTLKVPPIQSPYSRFTQSNASSRSRNPPSNWRVSTASRISPILGPSFKPSASRSFPRTSGGGIIGSLANSSLLRCKKS